MKCSKCKYENIVKASYCQKCGYKFTEEEKKKSYQKTIYGKIEKLEKVKDIVTLDFITGNIIFKIISLLIVSGIVVYFMHTMGLDTKILKASDYKVFYNQEINEYYLLTDSTHDTINVNLYRPNRVKKMTIYHYSLDGTLIEEEKLKKDESVILNTFQEDYYLIESVYSNKKKHELKIYAYKDSNL